MAKQYDVDLVASDSPINVYRDGEKVSGPHNAEHKASAIAIREKLNFPESNVFWQQDRKMIASATLPATTPSTDEPESTTAAPDPDPKPPAAEPDPSPEQPASKPAASDSDGSTPSLTPKEPPAGWFQTDLSQGDALLQGVGDNAVPPAPSMQGITDFSPSSDRKIGPRKPIDPWPHFEPEHFDLPDINATFTVDGGPVLTINGATEGLIPFLLPDGSKHPHLRLDVYDDGVIPENPYINADTDYEGVFTLEVDGKIVHSEHLVLVRGTGARPVRHGFKQHAFHPINPAALPTFDYIYGSKFDGSKWYKRALDVAANGLHDPGMMWINDMSEVGGHTYLGVLPAWVMGYVLAPSDQNATAARAGADGGMAYNIRVRDPETDLPINLADHPKATLFWEHLGKYGNPIEHVKNSLQSDMKASLEASHLVGFGIVAALATGSRMDRMSMAFYGNYAAGLFQNPEYRGYGKCLIDRNQLREEAWLWRTLAYAAILSPDELKPYFDQAMRSNEDRYQGWYGENGTRKTPLHIDPDNQFYPDDHDGGMGFSPWEHNYKGAILELLVRLGYTTLASSRDYIVTQPIQFSAQACYQRLADYTKHVKAQRGGPIAFGNWRDVMRYEDRNADNSGKVCGKYAADGNPDHIGEIQPGAYRAIDYPAWMQPMIAAAADSTIKGGSQLWKIFDECERRKIQWGDSPNWNIVPEHLSVCPHDMTQTHQADPKCFARAG